MTFQTYIWVWPLSLQTMSAISGILTLPWASSALAMLALYLMIMHMVPFLALHPLQFLPRSPMMRSVILQRTYSLTPLILTMPTYWVLLLSDSYTNDDDTNLTAIDPTEPHHVPLVNPLRTAQTIKLLTNFHPTDQQETKHL
jgi:hypothetical protein